MSGPSNQRTAIPAELRRRVLVEAGHRCAIPTCRYIEVEVHHIVPWTTRQEHEYENLIALCPNCHGRADRGEIDRKSLILYKANLRFTHDRFSQLEVDKLFEAYKSPQVLWPALMLLTIKRIVDSGFIGVARSPHTLMPGIDLTPLVITVTPEGRQYVDDLSVREL